MLNSDQEPAITYLQKITKQARAKALHEIIEHIKSIRGMDDEIEQPSIVLGSSPVGESKANGAVENAINRLQGQV